MASAVLAPYVLILVQGVNYSALRTCLFTSEGRLQRGNRIGKSHSCRNVMLKRFSTWNRIGIAKTRRLVTSLSLQSLGFIPRLVACELYSRKSVTGTGSSLNASGFSCQCDATSAPYSFSHQRRQVISGIDSVVK